MFDIIYQKPSTINDTINDIIDGGYKFIVSNGIEIFSRSRMDIQTERLWLKGPAGSPAGFRSGTMVFSSNEKRGVAMSAFIRAIDQWNTWMDTNPNWDNDNFRSNDV